MSFLLHGILKTRTNLGPQHLSGLNNFWPVFLITAGKLSAAVSRIGRSGPSTEISHMLAYEKTVAILHREFTVVPMRYGCVLEEEQQIVRLLESRVEAYTALLSELEGRVEMGIRALRGCDESLSYSVPASIPHPMTGTRHSSGPGSDYLAARRLHHARREQLAGQGLRVIEKIRGTFAGLYSKCIVENHTLRVCNFALRAPLLSLHFLVPTDSVEAFRQRFHGIRIQESPKLLLSGPWPPFNFIVSDRAPVLSTRNTLL